MENQKKQGNEKKKEEIKKKEKNEVSEKKKTNTSEEAKNVKEKNNKNKKRNTILIISGVALFILLVIIFLIINKQSDTHRLANKIINDYKFNLNGSESIFIYDQGADDLNEYSYLEASLIYISNEEKKEISDIVPEISIAKYNSDLEATEKVNYFNNYYKKTHEKIDGTFYPFFNDVQKLLKDEEDYIFSINNYVININSKYKDEYNNIKKILTDNIEKSNPKNIPNKNDVAKYWNEKIDADLRIYDDNYDINVQQIKDYLVDYIDNFNDCTLEECKKYYENILYLDKFEDFKEEMQKVKDKYNEVVIKVIDFKNVSFNDAKAWCTNNNLNSCYVSQEYSDTIPNGGLILQSVQADEVIKKDSKISVVYSKGKEPSLEYKNALKEAHSYLNSMAFSYEGLIRQLEFEGYSHDASVYAVDNCGADWNEQAYKMAQSYLNSMAFSRQGLINQLIFEKFTREQAEYGVNKVGL